MVPPKSRHVFIGRSVCSKNNVAQTRGAILPAGLSCAVKRLENMFAEKTPSERSRKTSPCRNGAVLPSCSQLVFRTCQIFVRSRGKRTDLVSINVSLQFSVWKQCVGHSQICWCHQRRFLHKLLKLWFCFDITYKIIFHHYQ